MHERLIADCRLIDWDQPRMEEAAIKVIEFTAEELECLGGKPLVDLLRDPNTLTDLHEVIWSRNCVMEVENESFCLQLYGPSLTVDQLAPYRRVIKDAVLPQFMFLYDPRVNPQLLELAYKANQRIACYGRKMDLDVSYNPLTLSFSQHYSRGLFEGQIPLLS